MADTRLTAFVEAALNAGAKRDAVRGALEEAGWSKDQVADGLAHYSDVAFVVPVPRPKAQVSARDAFWYLLMFGTLYTTAFYLCNIAFLFINSVFPDDLDRLSETYTKSSIRWATAVLIVAFPCFLLAASRTAKEIAKDPARRNSAIRKWLTYVTLLFAATAIIVDCMTLVFNLLGGELTLRFISKVVVVLLVAGAVFGYYTWSLRTDDEALKR